MNRHLTLALTTLLLSAASLRVPAVHAAAPHHTDAETYISVTGDRLTRSGGMLYVTAQNRCPALGDFPTTCIIRSRPTDGGLVNTLLDTSSSNVIGYDIQSNVAADATHVYIARRNGAIARHTRSSASGPLQFVASKVLSTTETPDLDVDATYMYWAENISGFGGESARLYRAPKSGGTPQLMQSFSGTTIRQLKADGAGGVYYIASAVFRDLLFRTYPVTGVFTSTFAAAAKVSAFAFDSSSLYWADTLDGSLKIKRVARNNINAAPTVLVNRGSVDSPQGRSLAVDSTYLYWHEYRQPYGGPIYRVPLAGGSPVAVTDNLLSVTDLASDGRFLFWLGGAGGNVSRQTALSAPVTLDLIGNSPGIEVLQTVQGTANDTQLIAGKLTFARIFGRIASSSLALTSVNPWPDALLYGTRDGIALPGSPLRPLTRRPITSAAINRNSLDQSVLFELPPGWTQGTVTLRGEINPGRSVAETDYTNNTSSATVTFNAEVSLCLDMVPVLTNDGVIGSYSADYDTVFARAVSVWPVNHFRTLWRGGPAHMRPDRPLGITGSGPYNLNSDDEMSYLLSNLGWSYLLSSDPPGCGGAHTIRVAAVQNASRFGMSSGTWPVIFFLMRYGGSPVNFPDGGLYGLAHELGHQMGREHIGCPTSGPNMPASPDSGYPYPPCSIDNAASNSYAPDVGFDSITRQVLTASTTADFMSYGPDPTWASDYTFNAIRARLVSLAARPKPAKHNAAPAGMLLASGTITSSGMYFAPTMLLDATLDVAQSRIAISTKADYNRQLRALDAADNIVWEQDLNIATIDSEGATPVDNFYNLIPLTVTFKTLLVVQDGAEVGRLSAGAATPIVSFTSTTPAVVTGDTMNIDWSADDTDGDPLLYQVLYSADAGKTWTTLGSPTRKTSLSVDLNSGVPGGKYARIQVIASDGVHSSAKQSEAFTVPEHAPSATILDAGMSALKAGATFTTALGDDVVLEGRSYDAEDGPLDDAALTWSVDGPITSTTTGPRLLLPKPAPGTYTVTLVAQDSSGASTTSSAAFTVGAKQIPVADAPTLDGDCNDASYSADSDGVSWKSADGVLAGARFVRSGSTLFICFSGMPLDGYGNAGLYVSGASNIGYTVGKDGVAKTWSAGDSVSAGRGVAGNPWIEEAVANGVEASVSVGDATWQAEMKIDAARFGGGDHSIAMVAGNFGDDPTTQAAAWPAGADLTAPSSWAGTDPLPMNVLYMPMVTR